MPTGPPPPNYTGGPGQGGALLVLLPHSIVRSALTAPMRRAYVPYNSTTGVGQAYTAGRPTMGQQPPGGAQGASLVQNPAQRCTEICPSSWSTSCSPRCSAKWRGNATKAFVPTLAPARHLSAPAQGANFRISTEDSQQQQPQAQAQMQMQSKLPRVAFSRHSSSPICSACHRHHRTLLRACVQVIKVK